MANSWTTNVDKSGTYKFQTAGTFVDRNIEAVVPKAVETVSGEGSATITASMGAKTSGKYPITGSGSITGTATANVSTKGFTDQTSFSGSITGTANVSGSVNAAAIKVVGSATVKPNQATKNSATNINVGTVTSTQPTSGYYLSVDSATPNSTNIIQSTAGSTSGYVGAVADEVNASGAVTGGSTTTYFAIPEAITGGAASGTLVSTITPGPTAKNVNISEGYTNAKYWKVGEVTLDIAKEVTGNSTISTSGTDPGATYSENTSAVVPAGGYLLIGGGYVPATKISLKTLVPDGASSNPAEAKYIAQGKMAYDSDANLITGTMPEGSIALGGTNPTEEFAAGSVHTIKAGYYENDVVIKAQDGGSTDPAVLAASATAEATISSASIAAKGAAYEATGTAAITGISTASVATAGYASGSLTGTGTVSGTATAKFDIPAAGLSASGEATASKTGVALTPSGSYGAYTFSQTVDISGTAKGKITSAGYSAANIEKTGDITGTATFSGTIASGALSGALHADSSQASGYDVYRINGSAQGWIPASQTSGNACVDINVYQGTYTVV